MGWHFLGQWKARRGQKLTQDRRYLGSNQEGHSTLSLYTNEIRDYIRSRDWPKGLVMDVREYDQPAPHLKFVFFRDNWLTFTYDDQMKIHSIVKEVMHKLWGEGVPAYADKMESVHGQ